MRNVFLISLGLLFSYTTFADNMDVFRVRGNTNTNTRVNTNTRPRPVANLSDRSCIQDYKNKIAEKKGELVGDVASSIVLIGLTAVGQDAYYLHQYKKMLELLIEARNKRQGPYSKKMYQSLNRQMPIGEIHARIRDWDQNRYYCDKSKLKREKSIHGYLHHRRKFWTYREVKDGLRFKIDKMRVQKRQQPIWNEVDDLKY